MMESTHLWIWKMHCTGIMMLTRNTQKSTEHQIISFTVILLHYLTVQ